jgi:hypothetical protein
LLLWTIWAGLDDRLAWHAAVGYSSIAALVLNIVYTGRHGINDQRWTTVIATLVAFNVSFIVGSHASRVGTFLVISIGGGALVSSAASGLIVVVAIRTGQAQHYGTIEDAILLTAPLIEAAMIAGVTSGVLVGDAGRLSIGLAASVLAGAIVSIFVLAWIYLTVSIVSSWLAKDSARLNPLWWQDGYS